VEGGVEEELRGKRQRYKEKRGDNSASEHKEEVKKEVFCPVCLSLLKMCSRKSLIQVATARRGDVGRGQ